MTHSESTADAIPGAPALVLTPMTLVRIVVGGVMMGVANIIPGVSGGTMILAMGLYEWFVQGIADVTRLRFRFNSLVFLALLGVSALTALFLAVEPINYGLTHFQHVMFALFIGLTLGGVPMLWVELRPIKPIALIGIVIGVIVMIGTTMALARFEVPVNFFFLLVGGIVGSAAMVLPGISGSYLLLALGLYFPITDALSAFKDALAAADMAGALRIGFGVLFPVGLGVIIGIAGLTNLLKLLLQKAHSFTLGSLLGLLLGSVVFLYPFKEPGNKDPFEAAAPMTPLNIALVIAALLIGFAVTYGVSKLGGEDSGKKAA